MFWKIYVGSLEYQLIWHLVQTLLHKNSRKLVIMTGWIKQTTIIIHLNIEPVSQLARHNRLHRTTEVYCIDIVVSVVQSDDGATTSRRSLRFREASQTVVVALWGDLVLVEGDEEVVIACNIKAEMPSSIVFHHIKGRLYCWYWHFYIHLDDGK